MREHSVEIVGVNWRNQKTVQVEQRDAAGNLVYNETGGVVMDSIQVYDPKLTLKAIIKDGSVSWTETIQVDTIQQLTGIADTRAPWELSATELDRALGIWMHNLDVYFSQMISDSVMAGLKTKMDTFHSLFTNCVLIVTPVDPNA